MLTSLDLFNLALASRNLPLSLIDPYTGELLDLKDSTFSEDDYLISYPAYEHVAVDQRLLADLTVWTQRGGADNAARLGLYIVFVWNHDALTVGLADVQRGLRESLAIGKARKRECVFHIETQSFVEVGDKVAA